MENQQVSQVQRLQSAFNSLFQGLDKANQKGVFQFSESSTLFQSLMLLKQYIESTLSAPAQAQSAQSTQSTAQPAQSTENINVEVSK